MSDSNRDFSLLIYKHVNFSGCVAVVQWLKSVFTLFQSFSKHLLNVLQRGYHDMSEHSNIMYIILVYLWLWLMIIHGCGVDWLLSFRGVFLFLGLSTRWSASRPTGSSTATQTGRRWWWRREEWTTKPHERPTRSTWWAVQTPKDLYRCWCGWNLNGSE